MGDYGGDEKMNVVLKKFQMIGARTIRKYKGIVLLADEMGLGKTLQVLYWLYRCPKKRPVVIVSPATIKWVWESQAAQHLNMHIEVLQGKKPPRKARFKNKPSIVVINYEIFKYWVPYIKRLKPKVLVLDESHKIKNPTAGRTKAIVNLTRKMKIPHRIAVTGTPLLNNTSELFTTLNLLWPKKFPSYWRFVFRYCHPRKTKYGWTFKGARRTEELHRKLKRFGMIRRLKKDVLKELPAKIRMVIPLEIQHSREYRMASRDFLNWLKGKDITKLHKAKKAKAMLRVGYLKRLAAELKMKSVFKWLDDFLETTDKKIVVFAHHTKIINMLHKRYKKTSVVVKGGVSQKKRQRAVKAFQTGKPRMFIGNILAAGVGLTLTAAEDLAFVELDFVPGNMIQAEDRIHRIGQRNAACIYYLVAKGTMEEGLCETLQKKQKNISKVLEGKGDNTNELNIFEIMMEAMDKEIQKKGKRK